MLETLLVDLLHKRRWRSRKNKVKWPLNSLLLKYLQLNIMEEGMTMKEGIAEIKIRLNNRWYSAIISLVVTFKELNIVDPVVPETLEWFDYGKNLWWWIEVMLDIWHIPAVLFQLLDIEVNLGVRGYKWRGKWGIIIYYYIRIYIKGHISPLLVIVLTTTWKIITTVTIYRVSINCRDITVVTIINNYL